MENKENAMGANERDALIASIIRVLKEADDPKLMQIYLFVIHIL